MNLDVKHSGGYIQHVICLNYHKDVCFLVEFPKEALLFVLATGCSSVTPRLLGRFYKRQKIGDPN